MESPKSVKMKAIKTPAKETASACAKETAAKETASKETAKETASAKANCLTFNDHQAIKAIEGKRLPVKQLRHQRQQIKNQLQQRIRRRMMAKGQMPPNPTEEEIELMRKMHDTQSFSEFLTNNLGNEYIAAKSPPPIAPAPMPAPMSPNLYSQPSSVNPNLYSQVWLKGFDPYLAQSEHHPLPLYYHQAPPVLEYAFSVSSTGSPIMMDSIFNSPSMSPQLGIFPTAPIQSVYEHPDLYPLQFNPDYYK